MRTQVPACRSSQNENDTGEGKFMNGSLLVKNFLTNRLSEAAVSCALFVQMVDSLVTLHLRAVEETLGPEFSVHSSSPAQQSDRRSLRIQFRSISTERNSTTGGRQCAGVGVKWLSRKLGLPSRPTSRSTSVSRWRLALGVSCLRLTSSFLLRATSTSSLSTT